MSAFQLDWQDNSDNEVDWEIRVALKGTKPTRFVLFPSANATTYTLIISNSLPGKKLNFQIAAYNYKGPITQLSEVTPIVTAQALSPTTFRAPTELVATSLDDSTIRLVWKDNSTSEFGYQMEFKPMSSTTWGWLGKIQAGTTFSVSNAGFAPATSYQFRVRAFRDNPLKFTGYSGVVDAKTSAFRAPSDLVATSHSEGKFSFKWNDRSSLEAGYELEAKAGTGAFVSVGTVPANTSSTDPVQTQLKTDYSFRLRAFRFDAVGVKIYSDYSNTFAISSSALSPPENLVVTPESDSTASLK